jgi:hypothetical protein
MAERGAPRLPALLALVLLLPGLLAVVRPTPAGAATGTATAAPAAPAASPPLVLRSQTTWWRPDEPFSLVLGIDPTDAADYEVVVSVFGLLRTRTAFAATIDGRTTGRPLETTTVAVADLPTVEGGDRVLTFTPTLRNDGVYPVRVELRPAGGGDAVASFVTHVVVVPPALEGDRLSVAAILPVHAPPATQPDGTRSIDDQRAELLAGLATSLESRPDVPLTLAPTPETVDALAASPRGQDATTLAALVRATAGRQLLGAPYVPTNLNSILDAGLEDESAEQLNRGMAVLRERLGAEPTSGTRLVDERLGDDALAHLQTDQHVVRLVVPEPLLDPIARNKTLTATFGMTSRRGPVAAAVADDALAAHFREASPVLAAQHLLADLAQIYNDDPTVLRRGVVVTPSRAWEPDGDFVRTFLAGLGSSPILGAVGIDGFFDAVDPAVTGSGTRATPLVRRIGPAADGAPDAPALPGAAIRSVRQRLDTFAGALVPADPVGRGILDALDRALLIVPSIDLRVRDRTRYLAGIEDQLDRQLAAVAMPPNRSITLTAREGDIPITITSRLGYPLRVVLRVTGTPVEFPDGDRHDLELQRANTTSRFTVRAPSSGSFPIRVRLTFPDSDETIAESRFTVRSTAISGVGTGLSIGAALFLVVWWGNHLRGRRRSKRLVPA